MKRPGNLNAFALSRTWTCHGHGAQQGLVVVVAVAVVAAVVAVVVGVVVIAVLEGGRGRNKSECQP